MLVWARQTDIQEKIAAVPENWLRRFAAKFPEATRKLGEADCSTLLFHVPKVLEAIELGLCNRKYNYAADPTKKDVKKENQK